MLANMAARTDTRQKLLSQDLVQVLLYLLAASPETQGDLAAMAATQRVQQKAAIGISRLAGEALIVEGILSGSGLDRLVEHVDRMVVGERFIGGHLQVQRRADFANVIVGMGHIVGGWGAKVYYCMRIEASGMQWSNLTRSLPCARIE